MALLQPGRVGQGDYASTAALARLIDDHYRAPGRVGARRARSAPAGVGKKPGRATSRVHSAPGERQRGAIRRRAGRGCTPTAGRRTKSVAPGDRLFSDRRG
jgi:hypothetical protein